MTNVVSCVVINPQEFIIFCTLHWRSSTGTWVLGAPVWLWLFPVNLFVTICIQLSLQYTSYRFWDRIFAVGIMMNFRYVSNNCTFAIQMSRPPAIYSRRFSTETQALAILYPIWVNHISECISQVFHLWFIQRTSLISGEKRHALVDIVGDHATWEPPPNHAQLFP